jgi:hypothetical protein
MKILERKIKSDFQFRVLKPFIWNQEPVKPGDVLTLVDNPDCWGLVQVGKIEPVDIEDGMSYVALRDISLPSQIKEHSCKRLEIIALTKADGLMLMLDKGALPTDASRWRPYHMKLRSGNPNAEIRRLDELQAAQHAANVQALEAKHYPKRK